MKFGTDIQGPFWINCVHKQVIYTDLLQEQNMLVLNLNDVLQNCPTWT